MKHVIRFFLAGILLSPVIFAYIYRDQIDFAAYAKKLQGIVESPIFIAVAVAFILFCILTLRAGRISRKTAAVKRQQLKKKVLGR